MELVSPVINSSIPDGTVSLGRIRMGAPVILIYC